MKTSISIILLPFVVVACSDSLAEAPKRTRSRAAPTTSASGEGVPNGDAGALRLICPTKTPFDTAIAGRISWLQIERDGFGNDCPVRESPPWQ